MFSDRLQTLVKAYKGAERGNKAFTEAQASVAELKSKLIYVNGIDAGLAMLNNVIAQEENKWQDFILRSLEAEIVQALSFVYPSDGYNIELSARVLRGKIHIECSVKSYFAGSMKGALTDSQGCLFRQTVSFAALVQIMHLLGVSTVYIDEAFSGTAKDNVPKLTALLNEYKNRGYNLIIIAQDTKLADGIDANILYLSRSLDNKTSIQQNRGQYVG